MVETAFNTKGEPTVSLVPKEEPTPQYKPDEDQIAMVMGEKLTGRAAYFHAFWRVYENGAWIQRDSTEMRRYIRQESREFRKVGVRITNSLVGGLLSLLEDDLYVSDRTIMTTHEDRKRYVNLRNGLFNLETFELEPHRSDLYFTNQLDFDYDPDAMCPTFDRYIRSSLVHPGTKQTDHSLVRLTLEALGYSMTARTDLKSSFWLVGEKDSGKSTFVALIKSLMGSLYGTLDLTQLGTNRFLLSGIVGKRVIAFTEASGAAMLPDALYKALVGGSDEVYADVKNRDPITFRPECKLWWAMNDMPRVQDRSGATTRRIIIIPFNRTIPESERIPDLESKLIAERPGIFNHMVNHYIRLVNDGGVWERCEQAEDRRQKYILENDTEALYLQERADMGNEYRVSSDDLWHDYQNWCQDGGYRAKTKRSVAKDWERLGLVSEKSNFNYWRGMRFKNHAEIAK